MFESFWYDLAFYVGSGLLSVVAALLMALLKKLSSIQNGFKEDIDKRKVMWDEAMIHIHHKFDELLADHKDIKRMQEEGASKIASLEKEHANHERDQAVQLELLRDIKHIVREK